MQKQLQILRKKNKGNHWGTISQNIQKHSPHEGVFVWDKLCYNTDIKIWQNKTITIYWG